MITQIINWLFPEKCTVCNINGSYICLPCLSTCKNALGAPETWIVSLFSYKDKAIKQAIWAIKFHGHFCAADAFGELLGDRAHFMLNQNISDYELQHEEIVIIPIPPSKSGRQKRGYNQTNMIAHALFENASFNAKVEKNAIEKIKVTERQATIHNRELRLTNMDGAFIARPEKVSGRIILLVDDVTTTGATLRDARRALLSAGARYVFAITIAH